MIYQQSVFEPWAIESESVQSVISSPPYYALRKYSIPDIIIGGDKDCKHEFYEEQFKTKNQINFSNSGLKNDGRKEINRISTNEKSKFNHQENVYHAGFCIHCNAWKGQYGLEPTPDCGQPFMKLKEGLAQEEKEYVLNELRKYGAI